ncbi:MAG: HypC/HybG/HupF family hydrogenase formation chaperone [Desulfovibrio sp.]|nr:HypC/HybG/HupF family hydrogenase formation chaperone [Desulfovibrio sp.]
MSAKAHKNHEEKEQTMCVGLSAKVVSLHKDTAIIDAQGARREVSARLLSDLEPGDYVMVHAGIAIAKIGSGDDEESAKVLKESLQNA